MEINIRQRKKLYDNLRLYLEKMEVGDSIQLGNYSYKARQNLDSIIQYEATKYELQRKFRSGQLNKQLRVWRIV